MKQIIIVASCIVLALSASAKNGDNFSAFARTKDSLMHLAFYDKDLAGYKKHFNEFLTAYYTLDSKGKDEYRPQVEEEYYYLARAYAIRGDRKNAIDNLERSRFYDYKELSAETDFNSLSKDPRFVAHLNAAKNQRTRYEKVLQTDGEYGKTAEQSLPPFVYQSATNPNLVALKTRYNLDSIAGQGNDVARIINLMKWVHYLLPHDGSKGNPDNKNAMSMIRECRRDKKTLNCRGLAIVLNEVYLATGFKSRFVTCMPQDTADNDCHVITMVWSTSLNKWLWMDPTFMAYVMNEEGTLLSIEEVRERIIHGKTLILNPDANHNHNANVDKGGYLRNYMAKNLYKLECPVSSEYSYETKGEGKSRSYIQLRPGRDMPETTIAKDQHGVDVFTRYYSGDPVSFWAKPSGLKQGGNLGRGHSQAEYEKMMASVKDCYNKSSGTCMDKLFVPQLKGWLTDERISESIERYGKIRSCTFLSMEIDNKNEDVALFKMVCDKKVFCMGLGLDDNNQIKNYRFQTSSNYIEWLMARSK